MGGRTPALGRVEEDPLRPRDIHGERILARHEPSIVDVRVDRSMRHRTSRRAEDDVEVSWVRIRIALRLRSFVDELYEPERPRVTDDRAADFFPDLARQGCEERLCSL